MEVYFYSLFRCFVFFSVGFDKNDYEHSLFFLDFFFIYLFVAAPSFPYEQLQFVSQCFVYSQPA